MASGQIGLEAAHELLRERRQRRGPAPPWRALVPQQFSLQRERPGPSIGALEPASRGLLEIAQLAGHPLLRELRIEQRTDRIRLGHVREAAQQPGEKPMAVHGRMPVEAAKEDRVQCARPLDVLGTGEHVIELVGIFLRQMTERDGGKARGDFRGESR